MLVGVAFLPPSFPHSRTQAFYIIKRQNCVQFCNTVYMIGVSGKINWGQISIAPLCSVVPAMEYGVNRRQQITIIPLHRNSIIQCTIFFFSVQRLGHQNLHLWIHNLHHFLVTGHYNLLLLSVCSFLYCALLT